MWVMYALLVVFPITKNSTLGHRRKINHFCIVFYLIRSIGRYHVRQPWKCWLRHAMANLNDFYYVVTPRAMSHCGMCPISQLKRSNTSRIQMPLKVRCKGPWTIFMKCTKPILPLPCSSESNCMYKLERCLGLDETAASWHSRSIECRGWAIDQADRQHLFTAAEPIGRWTRGWQHHHRAGHTDRYAAIVAFQSA